MAESFLAIGHPGHELRVFGWLERNRPTVFCLTDGGGAAGKARAHATAAVLERAGAKQGDWFGTLTDRSLYASVLEGRPEVFADRARQLADAIVRRRPEVVLSDMIEGYNPAHDLCRSIVNAAIELAAQRGAIVRRDLAFPLTGAPGEQVPSGAVAAEVVDLDPGEQTRKLEAACGYAALDREVADALDRFGARAFGREVLFAAAHHGDTPPELPPYYESYGGQQVAAGRYARVLRYRAHLAPLVCRLRREMGLAAR